MALTPMLTSNSLTVKQWGIAQSVQDYMNFGQLTAFHNLVRRGAITAYTQLQKNKGDTFTVPYVNKLTKVPLGEGSILVANEEALNLGSFQLSIGLTRFGVNNPNADTIEQQRTMVEFEKAAREQLPRRALELFDTSCFYQLAGVYPNNFTLNGTYYAGVDRLHVTGLNVPVAPSASRVVRPGNVANDESLTSSNTFTIGLLDLVAEKIANSDQPLQPLADGTYDVYISPEQEVDMRQDTTGAIQWYANELSSAASDPGLKESDMMGKLPVIGRYSMFNIYRAPRVAYGVNSSTNAVITSVRRAVVVGRNALSFASPWGALPTDTSAPFKYFTQLSDYDYARGIECRMVYGLKKTVSSNSLDQGVIVIPTYAAAHS